MANAKERYVKESPMFQGEDERLAYVLDTTNWGGYTSGATCVLKDAIGNNITSTNLSGVVSISTNYITSPLVISLKRNQVYTLEFKWVYSGNTFEALFEIWGER